MPVLIASLGCAALMLIFLVSAAMGIVALPFHLFNNTVQTSHDIIDKTINADNAIYNYEWFKQSFEDIKAIENKVQQSQTQIDNYKMTYGDASKWSFDVNNEYARLEAVKQGQMSALEDLMATYNARSKMADRNIFKDGLIPQTLQLGSNILTNL